MVVTRQAGGAEEDAVAPQLELCTATACTPLASLPAATSSSLQLVVSATYAADHTLALVTADTVYLSTDGGHSLRAALRLGACCLLTATGIGAGGSGQPEILTAEHVYGVLGGTVVLLRSTDGGAVFSPAGGWDGVGRIGALEVLPDGDVLAAVAGSSSGDNGVRCSTDGGTTWSATC
jgi:hypothetical protein